MKRVMLCTGFLLAMLSASAVVAEAPWAGDLFPDDVLEQLSQDPHPGCVFPDGNRDCARYCPTRGYCIDCCDMAPTQQEYNRCMRNCKDRWSPRPRGGDRVRP